MKCPFRIWDRIQILRDHWYSHIPFDEKLEKIDDKLRLLLDQLVDIRSLKPATGRLRLRQELGVQILRLVSSIASGIGVEFRLDFGTLLGAVRHGGFVPWDDDVDISLMRQDYERLCKQLASGLPGALLFERWSSSCHGHFGIARVFDPVTDVHVDLYPYESFEGAARTDGMPTKWEEAYQAEFSAIANMVWMSGLSPSDFERIANWNKEHTRGDGNLVGIVPSMEFFLAPPASRCVFREQDIFPLKSIEFEGCQFLAPAEPERVLAKIYGDIMRFPADAGHPAHAVSSANEAGTAAIRARIDDISALVRQKT